MGGECSRHTRKARGCRSLFARQTGSKSSRLAYYENFGLVAEEVAKVSSDLVTPDREGKPETVRYEAINAMLLNEFLKEHRKVQEQGETIAELKNDIANLIATVENQAAQIQTMNDQLESTKAVVRIVANNQ